MGCCGTIYKLGVGGASGRTGTSGWRISYGDRLADEVDGAPTRIRLDVLVERRKRLGVRGFRAGAIGLGTPSAATARPRESTTSPHPLVHRIVRVDPVHAMDNTPLESTGITFLLGR
jgi:hypothetical protein